MGSRERENQKKSGRGLKAERVVRMAAADIPLTPKEELDRLEAAMAGPIDTSEISEREEIEPLVPDETGRLPRRRSPIRVAVIRAMTRHGINASELCKRARVSCPRLSQSAVYEFLKGRRNIGLDYLDAILSALELEVAPRGE